MSDTREYAAIYYSGGNPEVAVVLLTKGEAIVEYTLEHNDNPGEGRDAFADEFLASDDYKKVNDPKIAGLRIYECEEVTWNAEDETKGHDYETDFPSWDNGVVRLPTAEELSEIIAGKLWCPVW